MRCPLFLDRLIRWDSDSDKLLMGEENWTNFTEEQQRTDLCMKVGLLQEEDKHMQPCQNRDRRRHHTWNSCHVSFQWKNAYFFFVLLFYIEVNMCVSVYIYIYIAPVHNFNNLKGVWPLGHLYDPFLSLFSFFFCNVFLMWWRQQHNEHTTIWEHAAASQKTIKTL